MRQTIAMLIAERTSREMRKGHPPTCNLIVQLHTAYA